MRLSPKDFDLLQRAILALHECRAINAFKRALPAILLGIIPADLFYMMEFEHSSKPDRIKLVSVIDPAEQIKPDLAGYIQGAVMKHPIPQYFAKTGDNTALKLSDFYTTTHRLRETEFYERFYGPIGVLRKITIPAIMGHQRIGAIVLCGKGKDFTERDRLMLNLLRPHIDQSRRNADLFSTWNMAPTQPPGMEHLTPREIEIAQWLSRGKSNGEIAIILFSNVRTVEKHVETILKKLGVENRTAAAMLLTTHSTPGVEARQSPALRAMI